MRFTSIVVGVALASIAPTSGCSIVNATAAFGSADAGSPLDGAVDAPPDTCTPTTEACDGIRDDDCDGSVDEGCACAVGASRACPMGIETGECETGTQECIAPGVWDACVGAIGATSEVCDSLDNDCNGTPDDGAAATDCGSVPRGSAACSLGECVVASCTLGYDDCDTGFPNGCETRLATTSDCLECGDACAWACESSGCDDATQIAMGGDHACALRASGDVYCWGRNHAGQLGDGTTDDSDIAVRVTSLPTRAISIAAGGSHSCAVLDNGTVRCWGENLEGQLGDGTNTSRSASVTVQNLSGIPVRVIAGTSHSCALRDDGDISCWGDNEAGQLGIGSTAISVNVAMRVMGLPGRATDLSTYSGHTCAVVAGAAWCWGFNASGELGDGSTMTRTSAVMVPGLASVESIAVGYIHTCARQSSGAVRCWGNNGGGQLGDGTMTPRPTPTLAMGLFDVTDIDAAQFHTCARHSDGSVSCWGANGSGELGDGTMMSRPTAAPVLSLGGIATQLSAHSQSTCVLVGAGLPRCWGANPDGVLGDASGMRAVLPVSVLPP